MPEELIHVPTLQQLGLHRGNLGPTFPFLALGIPMLDLIVWDDDFFGDLIRGDATSPGIYEVVTGDDGAIGILADQSNGIAEIRASDGAGLDGEYCGVSLPNLAFKGDNYCVVAARIAIDTLATSKVEVGFTDVTTDAGAVNNLGTNTRRATDCAVWVRDTNDNDYWQCAGAMAVIGVPDKIEPEISPTAGEFEWLIVALKGNFAKFYRLDQHANLTKETAWMANAIEGGNKVCPWIFVQIRDAVDRNVQLDRWVAWGNRTTG